MEDLKSVIAGNIIELRKKNNWTQNELAEKLNYSDKAVSKWERAESVPDITVLKEISGLFNVSVDYLLEPEHIKSEGVKEVSQQKKRNRIIVALLSASLVFLIATVLFVFSGIFPLNLGQPAWILYIYALPPAFTVLLVFNSIWGKRIINAVVISLLVWSLLLALYLSFSINNIWLIFIIGVPAEIIILLFSSIKFRRR
jgi:transcriptional regulator with XRE-family HTH domain